jgi:hypothetical protein
VSRVLVGGVVALSLAAGALGVALDQAQATPNVSPAKQSPVVVKAPKVVKSFRLVKGKTVAPVPAAIDCSRPGTYHGKVQVTTFDRDERGRYNASAYVQDRFGGVDDPHRSRWVGYATSDKPTFFVPVCVVPSDIAGGRKGPVYVSVEDNGIADTAHETVNGRRGWAQGRIGGRS